MAFLEKLNFTQRTVQWFEEDRKSKLDMLQFFAAFLNLIFTQITVQRVCSLEEVGKCLNFCGLIRKPELYTNNSPKGMQFGETKEEGSWTCPNREVYLAFNFGSRKY